MPVIRLYHGSKKGIQGNIRPDTSRGECDFGCGFYTGDKPDQPRGLIAAWPGHRFYVLDCNLAGLNVKKFGEDYVEQMDWALFIAYNRGKIDKETYPALAKRYEAYNRDYDVIAGLIANDKMYQIIDEFFNMNVCDRGFLEALTRVKLGSQYVFKTVKACSDKHIKIVDEKKLSDAELKTAVAQEKNRKIQTADIVPQIKVKYRHARDVKYFDEILEEWNEFGSRP